MDTPTLRERIAVALFECDTAGARNAALPWADTPADLRDDYYALADAVLAELGAEFLLRQEPQP